MNKFIGMKELFKTLDISRGTYYALINPEHKNYDPGFPKPVSLFTGQKLRFSTKEIEVYMDSKLQSAA